MVRFTCNVCGAYNEVEHFATEPASCACGSNVRIRALIYLLSTELFGRALTLDEFPTLKSIRGIGMTDQHCYASRLAQKFDYTNTFYDTEPRLDFNERNEELENTCDFLLSADVLEHIAPPIDRALETACRLLKPAGFLALTVFCNPQDQMKEHYPELHDFRIARLNDSLVIVNRRRDGTVEIHENPIFHGGPGSTLEMREFGISALKAALLSAGFSTVRFLSEDVPQFGILFDHDVSQPAIAAKAPFVMSRAATAELVDAYRSAREGLHERTIRNEALEQRVNAGARSRWVRLGRILGFGPKLTGS